MPPSRSRWARSKTKGARDFVVKPAAPERIIVSIRNALDMKTLVKEVTRLKKTAEGGLSFDDLIAFG